MSRFYSLLLGLLLAAFSLRAQPPGPRPGAPNFGADAAFSCALAHERSAQRQATASVRHRQKMDGYDVKYYKLDIALENNSRNVSGNVRMLARTVQLLDSVAFELYPTYTIDSVVVNGRRACAAPAPT